MHLTNLLLQSTTFKHMLSLFCVRFQRFRIILEEIIQIIIVIKQWCNNFFFSSAEEAYEHFLAPQVSFNLIFRSLDIVRGNQIEINEIFSLIKILKYLFVITAFHCDPNSYLFAQNVMQNSQKLLILYLVMCKFKLFYQKVNNLARLAS